MIEVKTFSVIKRGNVINVHKDFTIIRIVVDRFSDLFEKFHIVSSNMTSVYLPSGFMSPMQFQSCVVDCMIEVKAGSQIWTHSQNLIYLIHSTLPEPAK